jgi:peptide deformylase/transcriptional regulator with XRE-family HTH domain
VEEGLVDRTVAEFSAALVRWRGQRGLSKKQLAAVMGFDPSYVSHVEARRHRPTEDFARRADVALEAAGELVALFDAFDTARQTVQGPRPRTEAPSPWRAGAAGLIVEREVAELTYVDGRYWCTVRRDLHNAAREAVTRFPVRIAVDRYPGEPERSNRHHRDHPLTLAEVELTARCGDEPMSWQVKQDRDTFKELWLLFENDDARFPLYPGDRATIAYRYGVGDDKWGHWFQRSIRLPTRHLTVHIDLPSALNPVVWGTESSLTAEAAPLRSPIRDMRADERIRFEWEIDEPALGARFRFEWRLRTGGVPAQRGPSEAGAKRPSDLMRGAGILQRGAPMLDRVARWFELPEQASLASDIATRLIDAVGRVRPLHQFHKGLGLSAPQLGIDWAAAVVCPPSPDEPPLVLLNPRIVGESVDHDEQYEGCLSFFDVRGIVSRPLLVEVEHASLDGDRTVSTFRHGTARLVAHEVDHLQGLLYPDRMPGDGRLLPVEEYHDQGQPWHYDHARE